jgi:hypothetical protein
MTTTGTTRETARQMVERLIQQAATSETRGTVCRWGRKEWAAGVALPGHHRFDGAAIKAPSRPAYGILRLEWLRCESHDDDHLSCGTDAYLYGSGPVVAKQLWILATDDGSPDLEHLLREGGPCVRWLRQGRLPVMVG